MSLQSILVHELRDEHRDREWVSAYGHHLIWCEDTWMIHVPGLNYAEHAEHWNPISDPNRRPMRDFGPGPFMEALHHKVLHS